MVWKKIAIIAVSVFVAFIAFVMVTRGLHDTQSTIFRVMVPESTPDLDAIVLHVEGETFLMNRVGSAHYEIEIDTTGYETGRPLRYGYSRGGFLAPGGEGGEYKILGNVGNRTFVPGKQIDANDTVTEWKWFPTQPIEDPIITSLATSSQVSEREEFWAGPLLVDFWNPNFTLQYDSTIAHLKDVGYEWVALAPPWDYQSVDPPVISGENVKVPAWPDEELRKEIRAFKSAGFKVYLQPQVCCTSFNVSGRSDGWWDAWYIEYENFVRFHAQMAREEGVDAFSVSGMPDSLPGARYAPSFAEERWDRIFETAKESGAPVGFGYHVLPPGDSPQLLWPQEATAFYDNVDFIALGMWNPVSDEQFPTQDEIDAGYDLVFREIDYNHNVSMKPIVLSQIAYFSEIGASQEKGPEEFPTWEDPAIHVDRYDAKTQAMIYESLMRHVAERAYIKGGFAFGYYYLDAPLNIDSDIRAKPAEKIFADWIKRISS
jgi:hypothetical protein